jgi:peptide/nickel transport system permease protein
LETFSGEVPSASGLSNQPVYERIRTICKNRSILVGGVILLIMTIMALAAPLITINDPLQVNVQDRLMPPEPAHWFGTDDFGRDLFTRVIYGTRISLEVGAYTVVLTMVIGLFFGLLAGYYKALDNWIMRIADGLMAFPSIVLAIAIMAALGPTKFNVIIAMTIVYIPRTIRIIRSAVMTVREFEYIEAARALGASDIRIIVRYILPNSLSPLIVQATFTFAYAILAEAGLSFLGVGTPPPAPSWGNILSDSRSMMDSAPWMALFPGFAIMITVLGLNMLGDGLRDQLDPRMKT